MAKNSSSVDVRDLFAFNNSLPEDQRGDLRNTSERNRIMNLFIASRSEPKKTVRESVNHEYEIVILWSDGSWNSYGKATGRGRNGLKSSDAWQQAELALLYEQGREGRIQKFLVGDSDD